MTFLQPVEINLKRTSESKDLQLSMSLSFKGFLLVRLNLFKRHLGFLIQQKKKERKKYTKRVYFEIGYILILERVLRRSVKKRISQYYPAC